MSLTDEDKAWLAGRFQAIDTRLDAMDTRLDGIDGRLDSMDTRLNGIDRRLDSMDKRFDRLDDYLLQFRTESIRRFEIIDNRLDFLAGSFHRIDLQIPALNKSLSDFGASAGQFARDQMLAQDRDADIVSRLAKLEEKMARLHPAA